jgi:hypothetical protein
MEILTTKIHTAVQLIHKCQTEKCVFHPDDAILNFAEHCMNIVYARYCRHSSMEMIRQANHRLYFLNKPQTIRMIDIYTYILEQLQNDPHITLLDNCPNLLATSMFQQQSLNRFVYMLGHFFEHFLPLISQQLSCRFLDSRLYISIPKGVEYHLPFTIYFPIHWRKPIQEQIQKYMYNDIVCICLEYCAFT